MLRSSATVAWPGNTLLSVLRKPLATLLVVETGILLISAAELQALPRSMRFQRLSTEEGLSQASGLAILQDSRGFMWFGTQNGLNRYDGYAFTLYKHDSQEPTSLAHNNVWTVCEDGSGNLWVGTDGGGLDRWDRRTDTFTHHRHDPEDPASLSGDRVRDLWLDSSGILWVGTAAAGLNRLDPVTGTFSRMRSVPTDPTSLSDDRIRALYEDHSSILWIGTRGGLNRLDRATRQIVRYTHDPSDPSSLSDNHVYAIHQDAGGNLWVGTDGGLHRLERDGGGFARYTHDPLLPSSLSDNRVRAVLEDQDGRLWIATDAGLNLFDRDAETFVRYTHDPAESTSLSHNAILSLYQDTSGVLWVGTMAGGLNRWNPTTWSFPHYRSRPKEPHGLSNDIATSFSEDAAGDLWIGTFGGGLNRWRRDSGDLVHYRNDPTDPTSLSGDRVMAVIHDRFGQLWAGTSGAGLNRLNSQSGTFTRYAHDPKKRDSLSSSRIMSLFEDREGILWVGTFGGGLNRFDRQHEKFVAFRHDPGDPASLSNDRVTCFTEDLAGRLWLGTDGGGLNRFAGGDRSFERYRHQEANRHSLASDAVMSLHVDPAGTLWVGTKGGGLDRLDDLSGQPTKAVFKNYSERDGLPNAAVNGIRSDSEGRLWLSTNDGLARFDPGSETFNSYDTSDGLQNDDFFFGAHYRSPGGEMFFGGLSGFNAFFPERIEHDPYQPPVVITGFLKRNKPVAFDRPIYDLRGVELSYRDSVFSFEFAALYFAAPERNRYRYKLEGFDTDWIDLGHRRRVTFTNLDSGSYTLRVQGSNKDGVWNETGTSIEVFVSPSPWATWWAYMLYVLVSIVGVVLVDRIWRTRLIRQQELIKAKELGRAYAALEQKNQEILLAEAQLVQSEKMAALGQLVAGVAHEINNPVNFISSGLPSLKRDLEKLADFIAPAERGSHYQKLRGRLDRLLEAISEGAGRTAEIVKNLRTFSRLDEAEIKTVDLSSALDSTLSLLHHQTRDRIRVVKAYGELPQVECYVSQLNQVFMNLLVNAIQAIDGEGTITITTARVDEDNVRISIRDTGDGMTEDVRQKVFDPFFTTKPVGQGTGLGLSISHGIIEKHGGSIEVESESGEGTKLTIMLPIQLPREVIDEKSSSDTLRRR